MSDVTPIRPRAELGRPPAAFGLTWTAGQNDRTHLWSLNGYTPDGVLSVRLDVRACAASIDPGDVVRFIATQLAEVDPGQAELMAGLHFRDDQ